ncbi:uncharacterized protein [Branchiostoma lanceolatum]|uniref:uncharacterized protein n=1 Tax=Branchiostoma lanceolatum TaxID=7740 RepID=UPI003453EFEB
MLLQREDNANEVVIECAPAKLAKKKFRSRKREGYTGPLPTGSVNLFEGQKVEVILQGNVSLGPGSKKKQQMTFHSARDNRIHMQVIAMASKDENGLDGNGNVMFYAVPRVEIECKKRSRARTLKKSVGKHQKPAPEEQPEPEFLCQLPIHVPSKVAKTPPDGAAGGSPSTSSSSLSSSLRSTCWEATSTGVGTYFHFIKEKVAPDWKDLAVLLKFEGPDINNIASRNKDGKSSCLDMLWEWRKLEGNAATIDVLMTALSEAKLQSVVDGLRKKYPEIACR